MRALSASIVRVIVPLTLCTCWLLEASPEHLSRASPRIPGLTRTVPRGLPALWVPVLPANQTQGRGEAQARLLTDLGAEP